MRVKICGITRPEDAIVAEAAGAHAIGLIFAARSKRRLSLEGAQEIVRAVGPFVGRVGVFVDAPFDEVLTAVRTLGLDTVQLHGHEDMAYAAALRRSVRVIRAFSFTPGLTPEALRRYPADAVLLDGLDPGSGEAFDWAAAAPLRACARLVLAGGLTPANVAEGIRALDPYAVDTASGVETSPGVKDAAKVRAFVQAALAAPKGSDTRSAELR